MFGRKKKQKSKKEPKMSKKQRALYNQFELGRVLQVDNDVDNKQHFKEIDEDKEDD